MFDRLGMGDHFVVVTQIVQKIANNLRYASVMIPIPRPTMPYPLPSPVMEPLENIPAFAVNSRAQLDVAYICITMLIYIYI